MAGERLVPAAWLPARARGWVQRVVLHWTAGRYTPSLWDRGHYHLLVDGEGRLVRGMAPLGVSVASVRRLNTGTAAISLCGMLDARPGGPYGPCPLRQEQVERACQAAAEVLHHCGLAVTERTCLDHAAVPRVYGLPQDRWDIQELPYDSSCRGQACSDYLRRKVGWYYGALGGGR